MNEMRKIIEAVEQIEESEKTVEDVLSYFNGYAGRIKDGYIAKYSGDQGEEWVTNIHVLGGGGSLGNTQPDEESYRKYGINKWELGDRSLVQNVRIYRLQKVL